jgi:hypothetical protein
MSKQQFSGHIQDGPFAFFLINAHNFSLSQNLFIRY